MAAQLGVSQLSTSGITSTQASQHNASNCSLSSGRTELGMREVADVEKADNIERRYLTFDTVLPRPNPRSTKGDGEEPPAAPDLSRYENPQSWSPTRKAVAIAISTSGNMMVAWASSSYAFAVKGLVSEFGLSTNVANVGITLYNIGFGVTPMLCAPLSESVGRYPVFVVSALLFLIMSLCCGVTTTFAGMLICRLLAGCGGSTFSTIVGGIVADLYVAKDRNTPMGLFATSTLVGTGLGLVTGGVIAEKYDWRWIFYVQTIITAVPVVLTAICLNETRGNVLLRKRAQALNKWYEELEEKGFIGVEDTTNAEGNLPNISEKPSPDPRYKVIRWKVEADDDRPGMLTLIGTSVRRPFHMLVTEPVVFFFSLWALFAWSILYLTFEAVPLLFTTAHGFNDYDNGLVFLSMVIGTLVTFPVCIVFDRILMRNPKLSSTPEGRLIFVAVASACLPIGLFWLGWTEKSSIPWIVPVLAVGCLSIGIFTIYLAVFNYFADVYGKYSSSAMAAQSFCRNVFSSVFPFFSDLVYLRLGFGPASSLLGGIGVLLMLAPILLLFNGPKIRALSKYMAV